MYRYTNTMTVQYITKDKAHKNGVLIPFKDWKQIEKDLKELEVFRSKQNLIADIKEAFNDVKLHMAGKKKLKSAKDLLDEL